MAERNAPMLKVASLYAYFSTFRGPGWILQPLRPRPWCPSYSQSLDILVLTKGWFTSAFTNHILISNPIALVTTSQVLDLIWHVLNKDSGPSVLRDMHSRQSDTRAPQNPHLCEQLRVWDAFLSVGSVCANLCSVYGSKSQSTCGPSNLRHGSNLVRSRVLGIH